MSNKYFLGVGINNYPSSRLCGCENDINDWYELLNGNYGFVKIREHLFDSGCNEDRAIYDTVEKEFINLLSKIKDDEDSIGVFVFSGHGQSLPYQESDAEIELYDEAIKLLRGKRLDTSYMSDDDFRRMINTVNPKGKLITIFDCCYAGTITDPPSYFTKRVNTIFQVSNLENLCSTIRSPLPSVIEKERLPKEIPCKVMLKTNYGSNEISLAACKPDELASEFNFSNNGNRRNGVFTRYAINIIEKNKDLNYNELFYELGGIIKISEQTPQLYGPPNLKSQKVFT